VDGRVQTAPEQNRNPRGDKMQRASVAFSEDMIDTASDFKRWPFLHNALGDCRDSLVALYLESDSAAIKEGHTHKMLVVVAAISATLAVGLAIIQSGLARHWPLIISEAFFIGLAGWSFWKGNRTRKNWLTERHKAEFCRLLKFKSIIRPGLWAPLEIPPEGCSPELNDQIDELGRISHDGVTKWLDDDTVPAPPGRIIPHDLKKLTELRDYYREKRLTIQTSYFKFQSGRKVDREEWWRKVPHFLFVFSVIVVALHLFCALIIFGLGKIPGYTPPHWTEVFLYWLIVTAVLFPVIGSGIRTWRSANEGTRNLSRFRAKYAALSNIEQRMKEGEITATAEAEAVLLDLWCAEQIMESEHREWLRLMIGAEWAE
jgi:uncharacterized membrane protein YhaH (DUF805 family)